jgi:hypothetical protein
MPGQRYREHEQAHLPSNAAPASPLLMHWSHYRVPSDRKVRVPEGHCMKYAIADFMTTPASAMLRTVPLSRA